MPFRNIYRTVVGSILCLDPASILYKSTAGHYQPVSYSDGPMAHYRFIKNAYWGVSNKLYKLILPASVAQLDAPSDWRPGGHRFNPC